MISRLPPTALRLTRNQIRFSTSAAALLSGTPEPQPTPLFLRPLTHSAAASDFHDFHRWAKSLALSVGTRFSDSDNGPDSGHLLRELTWLVQDATSEAQAHFFDLGSSQKTGSVRLRAGLEELYWLWRERVEERRPFQYIVGCEHWRDLVLVVRDGVLIPRPETEMLVDLAMEVEGFGRGLWADLGTGSGAIALGIGMSLGSEGRVYATDLSDLAVEVAKFNVERYGLKDKVEIRKGSWFEPLQDVRGKLAGIVSNPPYIPSSHISGLQAEVGRHEPSLALDGGENGIDHLLHLCEGSASALKPGGFLAFETNGKQQSEFIVDVMISKWGNCFCDVKIVLDLFGVERFVTGFRR